MGKMTKSKHNCIQQRWVKNLSLVQHCGCFSPLYLGFGEGRQGHCRPSAAPLTPCPAPSAARCRWAGTSGTWSPARAGVCRGCCPHTTGWQWPGCPWSCSPWRAGCSRAGSSWQRSTKRNQRLHQKRFQRLFKMHSWMNGFHLWKPRPACEWSLGLQIVKNITQLQIFVGFFKIKSADFLLFSYNTSF